MPKNPLPAPNLTHDVVAFPSDDTVVYVIQSSYHYRDPDNRAKCDEELLVEEGWFADAASAAVRCEQLNARNRSYYETSMAARKRSHDAKIREAEKANREAAAIRAAGMAKADVAVPPPFEPEDYETFVSQSNPTTYEAIAVRRSDHDGIARAGASAPADAGEPGEQDSTEVDAAKGAASTTA